ncbi:unnamed protein product, partial [Iphiclides podalirius]
MSKSSVETVAEQSPFISKDDKGISENKISEFARTDLTFESIEMNENFPPNVSNTDVHGDTKRNDDNIIKTDKKGHAVTVVPSVSSTEALQSKKSSVLSDIRSHSSLSFDMDSLLQVGEKIDTSAKPSVIDVTRDDEAIEIQERLVTELKLQEVDNVDRVSSLDMKNVDEYILKRQEVEDSVIMKQRNETTKQDLEIKQATAETPSTSRGNRYFFHVHYKDANTDDDSEDSSSYENLTGEITNEHQRDIVKKEEKQETDKDEKDEESKKESYSKK